MDIQVHSELSAHKFGGTPEDYFEIHKFIDSSKLFYFNVKHRSVLHHTFGIELCIQLFGDTIINSDNKTLLVRDIAAEHLKEDLYGTVPTLKDWFDKNQSLMDPLDKIQQIEDEALRKFVLEPYLNSGIKSSLLITFSDFGVSLVNKLLGVDKALQLRQYVDDSITIKSILRDFKFNSRWQYTPDMKQLQLLNKK